MGYHLKGTKTPPRSDSGLKDLPKTVTGLQNLGETLDVDINIEGFTVFIGDRESRSRGGAAVYFLNELNSKLENYLL